MASPSSRYNKNALAVVAIRHVVRAASRRRMVSHPVWRISSIMNGIHTTTRCFGTSLQKIVAKATLGYTSLVAR
jgi:hypothetical protein